MHRFIYIALIFIILPLWAQSNIKIEVLDQNQNDLLDAYAILYPDKKIVTAGNFGVITIKIWTFCWAKKR